MSSPPCHQRNEVGHGGQLSSSSASQEANAPPPSRPVAVTPTGRQAASPGSARWPVREPVPSASCAPTDAPPGALVRDVFLIQDIETRSGDAPHTILTFGNAGGRLRSAPFWSSERHRIERLTRGQAVEVSGTVGSWRGRRQLNVEMIRVLPQDKVPWDLLLPSIGNPEPWWQLLDDWRAGIQGPRLARTLGLLFDQAGFRHDFERCPASLTGHHSRLGGLLQHTCEVAHLALAATAILPAADPDLVLAGALLHDIGKIESYRWDGAFDTTVAGRV